MRKDKLFNKGKEKFRGKKIYLILFGMTENRGDKK